jgi:hypothetical protein
MTIQLPRGKQDLSDFRQKHTTVKPLPELAAGNDSPQRHTSDAAGWIKIRTRRVTLPMTFHPLFIYCSIGQGFRGKILAQKPRHFRAVDSP